MKDKNNGQRWTVDTEPYLQVLCILAAQVRPERILNAACSRKKQVNGILIFNHRRNFASDGIQVLVVTKGDECSGAVTAVIHAFEYNCSFLSKCINDRGLGDCFLSQGSKQFLVTPEFSSHSIMLRQATWTEHKLSTE